MALLPIPAVLLALALDDAAVPKEFNTRVGEYLKIRQRAVKGIPAVAAKSTPEQIHSGEVARFKAIQSLRANASQGEVFTPEIQQYILKIVRSETRGKDGKAARASTKDGNPATETPELPVSVKVNAAYPDKAPLSSVPPTILLRLPQLPKELDYRFIGRHLILRDTGANLIVDYIPNALAQ